MAVGLLDGREVGITERFQAQGDFFLETILFDVVYL